MKQKLSIVKIGGNVIGSKVALAKFLEIFALLEGPKILVHGGGKLATQIAAKLGIESKLIGGRRITDAETLKVITMVYAGSTNKNIVAQLQAQDCNAIGLSGADGDTIHAHKRPVKDIDYGFVGDVDGVNASIINKLLSVGLTPIFCAMTHDGNGQLLNTNADTIASELAIGLSGSYETALYYCFERKGVLTDIQNEDSVVRHLNTTRYRELLAAGSIADGMLPKLENCFYALNKNVRQVCIGHPEMLLPGNEIFTTLTL